MLTTLGYVTSRFGVKGKIVAGKFGGFLSASIVFAVMIGFVLVIAACSSDPTPAPTVAAPTPTVTSVPTAVPTPVPATATSTPIPPTVAPTATRVAISIDELEITETTTVTDIVAAFSEEEETCVREAIGADAFDLIKDIPVANLPGGASDFPLQCLTMESALGFTVASISSEAGGLSAETRSCITGIAAENPGIVGLGPPPESFGEAIAGAVQIQLCLTDEEAAAFAASQGAELPSPSALRCLEEQLGGEEALLAMLADEEQAEQAMLNLFSAALACEGGQGQLEATPTGG